MTLFARSLAAALIFSPVASVAAEPPAPHTETAREIEIVVDHGYKPGQIRIKEGERVRLRFLRKEYGACTREVVFPSLGIKRELPTNQPTVVELPPLKAGEVEFRCGMNMNKATIIVEPRA
jgi:plastocyanin domain-containing protein